MPVFPTSPTIYTTHVLSEEADMQIFYLEPMNTFILDVLVWVIFHLGIGYLSLKFPENWLDPNLHFFQAHPWEEEGKLYQRLFNVRSWKHLIPDGSKAYKHAYSIKHLASSELSHLKRWLKESVRSELCHWFMILPAPLFFLWNSIKGGWLMVLYAFLNNLVPIILQRFNRPRMRRLLAQLQMQNRKNNAVLICCPVDNDLTSVYQ
jgi:glycosyl-4,4'-diaponeurosporenoate acyltransferase